MDGPPEIGGMIAYCGHIGRRCVDKFLRDAGCDITPVQSQTLVYLSFRGGREVNPVYYTHLTLPPPPY
ncbi:MAG: hypothetical protein K2O45_17210, partial [Oscillospiraceae bacterium]|nr:hypothetical protein [Oscillospiraceae bacterium]